MATENDLGKKMESLNRYRNFFIMGAVLVAVVLVALWFVDRQKTANAKTAFEKLYPIQKQVTDRKLAFAKGEMPALKPGETDPAPQVVAKKKTRILESDYGDLLPELRTHIESNKDNLSGVEAVLLYAEVMNEYKKLGEAAPVIQSVRESQRKGTLAFSSLSMIEGNALESAGHCEQAIQAWEKVLSSKEFKFLQAEAAMRSGVCYERLNALAKAQEMYKKASEVATANSAIANEASQFLRASQILGTSNSNSDVEAVPTTPLQKK